MAEEQQPQEEAITISSDLAPRVMDELGENVYLCSQCVKCTSGCPVSQNFDLQPHQVMRALQLGQEDLVLHAQTPWLCASCQACTTRCPQNLNIAGIMDFLTQEALRRGFKPAVPKVNVLNEAFLRHVQLWRRAYEAGMMAEIKLRTLDFTSDMDLAVKMVSKNKIPFLPAPALKPRRVKPVPGAAHAIAYYPGCSLHSTATEFDTSTQAVCEALEMELIEPEGWVCCGSSPAHRADPEPALFLPLENLTIIEQSGFSEVTMPCAACFHRHKEAQYEIQHDPKKKALAAEAGYSTEDTVYVSTLIEALHKHVGLENVENKVTKPLAGLKVACFYDCLLTRPPEITGAPHPENPTDMDELVRALGAETVEWSYKTCCCGASHSLTRPDIVLELSSAIIEHARAAGADLLAVACPLCHANLDARQFQMNLDAPLPVLYFTQLMALALGLPAKEAALHKHLVDPRPLLQEKGVLGSE